MCTVELFLLLGAADMQSYRLGVVESSKAIGLLLLPTSLVVEHTGVGL